MWSPLAVTFSTLAIVSTPPRWLPRRSVTLRNANRPTQDAVVLASRALSIVKSEATKFVRLRSSFSTREEQFRFPDHRHLEHVVEFGVEQVAWFGGDDSERPSHWPTKFSVNAAAFACFSILST